MIKITSAMRRMVNDTEYFHIVKAVVEVDNMVRAYERKHRVERHQRYHDNMVAAPDAHYLQPKSNSKRPPVPITVRAHLDD